MLLYPRKQNIHVLHVNKTNITGWFGLRKDMCQFLLGVCPLLQEYANISYALPMPPEGELQQNLSEPNAADPNVR